MSTYTDAAVPVPAAYTRHLSYNHASDEHHDPNIYTEHKRDTLQTTTTTEAESLKQKTEDEQEISTGKTQKSLLMFLRDSRIYIRVLAILIMIVSFSLILAAVIMFTKAQNKPGNPLDNVPKPAAITDQPCIVFTGVAAMNLVLSITVLSLSCISTKFKKSDDALNAIFAILSAVGFATSMGTCFYLNKQTKLQHDLWKWSCGNHKKGIVSDAIDFEVVCHVVDYGWKFGLVQASLELLTFIVSVTAFVLIKYSYFARYGRMGKMS